METAKPDPDHFFFQLRISTFKVSLFPLRFHVLHYSRLLSLLLVVSLFFLFFQSFFFNSYFGVSFGYTIRLFIIQFSFYSDAKRRSSTLGKRRVKTFKVFRDNFNFTNLVICPVFDPRVKSFFEDIKLSQLRVKKDTWKWM